MNFIFSEIHSLNLPLAILLSFFGKVFYFKGSWELLERSNFHIMFFDSQNDFLELREMALNKLRESTKVCDLTDSGNEFNDNTNAQKIANVFEMAFFYNEFCKRMHGKTYFFHGLTFEWLQDYFDFQDNKLTFLSHMNTLLDLMRNMFYNLAKPNFYLIKVLMSFFKKAPSQLPPTTNKLFTSLSYLDIADAFDQQDFSFFIDDRILKSTEVAFILDQKLTLSQQEWLETKNVNVIYSSEIQCYCSLKEKLRAIATILKCILNNFHRLHCSLSNIALDTSIKSAVWDSFFRSYSFETLFYTNSIMKSEHAFVPAANSNQIKTVAINYSNSEYLFSNPPMKDFKDLSPAGSILNSKEVWSWDKNLEYFFKQRSLEGLKAPRYKEIGPFMFSSGRYLEESPEEVRKKFGIKTNLKNPIFVSYFDRPVSRMSVHFEYMHFISISQAEVDETLKTLIEIANEHPRVIILFKPKKDSYMRSYVKSEYFEKFISLENIHIFKPNINQYVPLVCSDIVVSLPFSSSVDAACKIGKVGVHFDPFGRVFDSYQEVFLNTICNTKEELINKINTAQLNRKSSYYSTKVLNTFFGNQ